MKPYVGIIRKILNIWILIFVAGTTFSIAVTQTAYFLAFVFWVLLMIYQKKSLVSRTPLDYYFLAYLIVGIIATIFSVEKGNAIIFVKRLLLIPIIYLIADNVRDKRFLKRLLFTLIGAMVILSFIGIKKYLGGVGGLQGRLKLFHHYMTSGGILMIVSLITFSFAFSSVPKRIRIGALAAGIIVLFPLIFTFTRSSWLGFISGLFLIGILQNKKLIVGLLLGIILFLLLSPAPIKKRALSILDPHHPQNVERIYMWKAGIKMMKDHPLTGVGDIDLGKLYQKYKLPEAKEKVGHLHNNFIMFGVTLGIPGLLVLLALFLKIFIEELKIYYSTPQKDWLLRGTVLGSLAVFIGFQVNGFFEWNFGDAEIAMLLWLTVGLALAVKKMTPAHLESRRK